MGSASVLFQNENYPEKSCSGGTPDWARTEFSLVYSRSHDRTREQLRERLRPAVGGPALPPGLSGPLSIPSSRAQRQRVSRVGTVPLGFRRSAPREVRVYVSHTPQRRPRDAEEQLGESRSHRLGTRVSGDVSPEGSTAT